MICVDLNTYCPFPGESGNIRKAMDWLLKQNLNELVKGRYSIEDDKIFALVSEYKAKEIKDCQYEFHRKYIDIQVLIEGHELIYVTPLSSIDTLTEYDKSRDIAFGNAVNGSKIETVIMGVGHTVILYPEDAHLPGIRIEGYEAIVKKIIIKVAVE
ncbi:MAG: YhcH/YjgK/YiaL family protein [Spirochaetaceae bacterium]|nr:YhcH/YjgK/YiaL family protein [Spirochaetaceae bacterium]